MAQETALEKAMGGAPLSEKQAQSALAQAVEKLGKEGGKLSKLKENMGNLGEALIHTGETQGTVFIASFAEGYLGEEKMDIGPVDLRLAGGVVSAGYGIYNVLTGKGGEHALAVGNGLISTALARVGRNAGKALAEKKDKKEEKKADGAAGSSGQKSDGTEANKGQGAGQKQVADQGEAPVQGDFGDLVRDIFLTPDEDAAEGRRERRGERPERAKPSRFIRATVRN